jgi:hypothetical protein
MSRLRAWLSGLPDVQYVPLFLTGDRLVVQTRACRPEKRLLCRSPQMERAIIDLVAHGLTQPSWRGILYVMAWGSRESLRPLYIGKAGRYGKTAGNISGNLVNVATDKNKGKFARWGDGSAYHIGALSQAIFGWTAYKDAGQKYERWAEVLLTERDPPRLRAPTHLFVVPWHEGQRGPEGSACTLEEAETQTINVAIEEFEDVVLNVQGETWWAPAASEAVCPPSQTARHRPYDLIATADALARLAADLAREKIIGLDVETTLYTQELRLVQIATRARSFIIDPLAVGSLEPLRAILGAHGPTKVIHNAGFERRILGEAGFDVAEVFDTLRVSRQLGPVKSSHRLSAVCQRHLGRMLDKSAQTSNWSARPLSRKQLDYAAIDAEVLLDLHEVLSRLQTNRTLF